jgi:hypothetical protein
MKLNSRKAEVVIPVVVFAAIGLFATVFGLVDALSARGGQYRLVGLAFALAGLSMCSASGCHAYVPLRAKVGRSIGLLAGLAGTLVGGYLLLMQIRGPQSESTVRLCLWSTIILASTAATIVAWVSTSRVAETQYRIKTLAATVASAGAISVAFGGIQWWYTNQYLPGAVGPALSIKTELKEQIRPQHAVTQAPADPYMYPRVFQARVTIRNTSKTMVRVISSIYTAERLSRAESAPQSSHCFYEQLSPVRQPECPEVAREYEVMRRDDPNAQDEWPASRYWRAQAAELVEVGSGS